MEKEYRLWLISIARIRKGCISKLMGLYGSAEAVYNLSESEINSLSFLNSNEKEAIILKEAGLAKNYINYIVKDGTRFITPDDEDYPTMLFDIEDAPYGLFCRGKLVDLNNNIQIAMVGARKCTQYGYECAKKLSRDAAKNGVIIVSGMAAGIDSAAHEGALEANMPTVAVLGCGVNVIYPSSNHVLMKKIMETGMVVSEYPVNMKPTKYTFPERNRIISGISHGLTVIEATERSGSLITARKASEQGRDLFAVPGNINSPSSVGANRLIRDGARLVTCAEDITEMYEDALKGIRKKYENISSSNEYSIQNEDTNDMEAAISAQLTSEPMELELLAEATGIKPADLSTTLLVMELSGKVIAYPGGKYSKPIL